jgi:hypothetical protein
LPFLPRWKPAFARQNGVLVLQALLELFRALTGKWDRIQGCNMRLTGVFGFPDMRGQVCGGRLKHGSRFVLFILFYFLSFWLCRTCLTQDDW